MAGEGRLTEARENKALFLDRDGVLIEYVPYLSRPEQVTIPEGAVEALKKWQDAGYLLIVITNQSGIGRGYFTLQDVEAVHLRMCEEYAKAGVTFQEILVCPHHPDQQCICRKPSPYMLEQASMKYSIELSQSIFIGDALSDLECAYRAGCDPVLLLTGVGLSTYKTLVSQNKINGVLFGRNLRETITIYNNNFPYK